jgi:lipopolysaccharide transport system permease protein
VLLLAALVVVFLFFGETPGTAWLSLPFAALLIAAIAFGLGILLGVFNTFARDVGQVFAIVLQFWFWVTPIVYTINVLPPAIRNIAAMNPITPLVRTYQDALLLNRWPDPSSFIVPLVTAVVLVSAAMFIFRRASAELVDAL